MTDRAKRYDNGKLRMDLVPTEIMVELARVYTEGAKKYDPNNWKKGMDYSRCIGALKRHLAKWELGSTNDSETGCLELAHVMWNAAALLYYQMHNLGTDDRDIRKTVDDQFNYVNQEVRVPEVDRRSPRDASGLVDSDTLRLLKENI